MADQTDALYVLNAVVHPDKFSRLIRPGRVQLTGVISTDSATTIDTRVKQLTSNTSGGPAVVYVEVQPGGNALTGYLYMAKERGKCTAARADVRVFHQIPTGSIILNNSEALFAYVTSPDDSGAALDVMFTLIPLSGRRGLLGAK